MKDSGLMKMDNFKKRRDHAVVVKVKPTIEKNRRKNETSRKVEDMRVNELAIIVTQFQEQIKQFSNVITKLCTPRCPNEDSAMCSNIEQINDKIKMSVKETEKE